MAIVLFQCERHWFTCKIFLWAVIACGDWLGRHLQCMWTHVVQITIPITFWIAIRITSFGTWFTLMWTQPLLRATERTFSTRLAQRAVDFRVTQQWHWTLVAPLSTIHPGFSCKIFSKSILLELFWYITHIFTGSTVVHRFVLSTRNERIPGNRVKTQCVCP